jgi:hypothetical protein
MHIVYPFDSWTTLYPNTNSSGQCCGVEEGAVVKMTMTTRGGGDDDAMNTRV